MEPSAGDDDSDDAEVFNSLRGTPADVLSSPAGHQQYDCHAGPSSSSSLPMWSDCLPIPVLPSCQPTDDMHSAADFLASIRQSKKTAVHANSQTRVYNFLERPTGWKCFLYHFSV